MNPLLPPPPPGGVAGALPMPAPMPTTYVELYRQSLDPLGGDYGTWLAGHSQAAANPGAVRSTMLGTPDTVAKVYLMLCPGHDGLPRVQTLFRPRQYAALPGIVTPWDGNVYGFATDFLGPGNQITTVQWPEDAFHLSAAEVYVKDVASMAEALTKSGGAASLGPYVAADANVAVVRTRMMMVVPHPYVPLVLGASLTPREAWMRLSTPITTDNRMAACAPLLDWLRIACTVRPLAEHAVAGTVAQSPVYHLPPVAVVPDAALAKHSWDIVTADMPQLLGATRSHEQALMHAVTVAVRSYSRNGWLFVPTPAPLRGEPPPVNPRVSAAVANPSPVAELLTAYQAIGWRSRQCSNAKQPPRGSSGQICVTYHGLGSCFDGCGRKASHKPLSGPDKDKLLAYYVELQALAALT
jgi:hypothetical protein